MEFLSICVYIGVGIALGETWSRSQKNIAEPSPLSSLLGSASLCWLYFGETSHHSQYPGFSQSFWGSIKVQQERRNFSVPVPIRSPEVHPVGAGLVTCPFQANHSGWGMGWIDWCSQVTRSPQGRGWSQHPQNLWIFNRNPGLWGRRKGDWMLRG